MSPARHDPQANLLPPLTEIRELSFNVAIAVARQACSDGLAKPMPDDELTRAVRAKMWEPIYARYRRLNRRAAEK
jgi:malate dehydrogenase (oxaloacetate-decarboxylating)